VTADAHLPVLLHQAVDALEVAAHLAANGVEVAGSRALRDTAVRVGAHTMVPAIVAPGRESAAIVRVDGDRIKLADTARVTTALVSVRALEPASGWDATFAWPFVADREQVLQWIEQSRARDVFVTGAYAESIVAALGPRARVLGPPRQMALFGS